MSALRTFAKTDAGRSEIGTRSQRLAPALRSLLLVVDGKRSEAQLRAVIDGLHAPPDALEQLEAMGLIGPGGVAAAPDTCRVAAEMPDASNRYGILYALMSDAVREHLGLRGYFLQLKIERAVGIDELVALLPELQASLARARGSELASEWSQRLQRLAGR